MIRHPKDNIRKQSVQDSIRKIRGQPHTHTHTHTRLKKKGVKRPSSIVSEELWPKQADIKKKF